jgi:hypothetical protein
LRIRRFFLRFIEEGKKVGSNCTIVLTSDTEQNCSYRRRFAKECRDVGELTAGPRQRHYPHEGNCAHNGNVAEVARKVISSFGSPKGNLRTRTAIPMSIGNCVYPRRPDRRGSCPPSRCCHVPSQGGEMTDSATAPYTRVQQSPEVAASTSQQRLIVSGLSVMSRFVGFSVLGQPAQ